METTHQSVSYSIVSARISNTHSRAGIWAANDEEWGGQSFTPMPVRYLKISVMWLVLLQPVVFCEVLDSRFFLIRSCLPCQATDLCHASEVQAREANAEKGKEEEA